MTTRITVAFALTLAVWLNPAAVWAHGFDIAIQRISNKKEAATIDSRSYTVGEIKTLLALRKARYRPGQAMSFGLQDLIQTAAEIPVYTHLADKGRKAGLALTPAEKKQLDTMVDDFMLRQLFRDEILERVSNPSLEQLKELYEDVKDSRFRTPERFIALEIRLAFNSEAEEATTQAKIQQYWQALEAGTDFPVLIQSIKDSATSAGPFLIVPEEDTETPPILIEALRDLTEREYSKPIKSENAWHIIFRHLYLPEGYTPFRAATNVLTDELRAHHRNALVQEYFRELTTEPGLFIVHTAALMGEGELALDSDVLLTVAEKDITRGELIRAAGLEMTREVSYRKEEFRRVALGTYPVQQRLLEVIAERRNYSEHPEVVFYQTALMETLLARKAIVSELDQKRFQPSEEDILLYRSREFLQRENDAILGVYDKLVLTTHRREAKKLEAKFSKVTSYEEFQREAERVSDQQSSWSWQRQIRRFGAQMPEILRTAARQRGDETLVIERPDSRTISIYWLHRGPATPALSEQDRRRIESNIIQNRIQDEVDRVVGTEVVNTEMEWTLNLYN